MTIADAQAKLLETYQFKPYAIEQAAPCPCALRSELYFSFLLEGLPKRSTDQDGQILEDCCFYCARCGFDTEGGRVVSEMRGEKS